MCLELGSPMCFHVVPASTLFQTPFPDETLPRTVTSPPPTYNTFGSLGATATDPILPPKYPSDMFL